MILKKRYSRILKNKTFKKPKKVLPIYINLYKYKFKFIYIGGNCISLILLIFILQCEVSFPMCEVSFQIM